MKKILFVLLLFSCLEDQIIIEKPVKQNRVYLITGQSNADGAGLVSSLPDSLKVKFKNVYVWTNNGWENLQAGVNGNNSNNTIRHGLMISLAKAESIEHPDDNLYFINAAVGGSNLHTGWKESGKNYKNMINVYKQAVANVDKPLKELIVWYQGESDSYDSIHSNNYQSNEATFISVIKKDTGFDNVLSVNISTRKPFNTIVRKAKEDNKGLYYLIDSFKYNPTNKLHLSSGELVQLGYSINKIIH